MKIRLLQKFRKQFIYKIEDKNIYLLDKKYGYELTIFKFESIHLNDFLFSSLYGLFEHGKFHETRKKRELNKKIKRYEK